LGESPTGNPFQSQSWLSMLRSFGVHEGACEGDCMCSGLGTREADVDTRFRRLFPASVADIVDGTYDLKVERVVAYLSMVSPSLNGDYLLELQDPSGTISGFISAHERDVLQQRGQSLSSAGRTVLLEQVPVFVVLDPELRRVLSVHSASVVAIW